MTVRAKVRAKEVSKEFFGPGRSQIVALHNLSIEIPAEKFAIILGPSGCGKSTFLRMLAGLEKPSSGQILVDERPVEGPSRDVGMVFQHYACLPWLTVQQNVEFGLAFVNGVAPEERTKRAQHYLELVGLRGFERAYPAMLSGGMRQRAAIARTLIAYPDLLLMDEPFAAVDSQTRSIMQELLVRIWDEFDKTILFVTHDIEEAIFLADIIYVLTARPGRLKHRIEVSLPRPRGFQLKVSPEFLELKKALLEMTREDSLEAVKYLSLKAPLPVLRRP